MPLIACPECNGHVSTEARQCPHCGASGNHIRRISFTAPRWGAAIALAVLWSVGAYIAARTGHPWLMAGQLVFAGSILVAAWARDAHGKALAFGPHIEERGA